MHDPDTLTLELLGLNRYIAMLEDAGFTLRDDFYTDALKERAIIINALDQLHKAQTPVSNK